jgi:3-oxoacyl-[acyl-carrier-protein] synthase II
MMQEGFVAPTLNLEKIDPRCAVIRHVTELMDCQVRVASIQNFAFGGVNTCLLLRKI